MTVVLRLSDIKTKTVIVAPPRKRRIQSRTKGKRGMKRLARDMAELAERLLANELTLALFGGKEG